MRAADPIYRLAFRLGYRAAKAWWRIRKPSHRGALIAVWCDGRVLAVRQSYAPHWTFPGGGIAPGESALAAASRELMEETGLRVPASRLLPVMVSEHRWNHRQDRVHFFELGLTERPELTLDRRELVEAKWLTSEELVQLPMTPHVREYLGKTPSRRADPAAAQGGAG